MTVEIVDQIPERKFVKCKTCETQLMYSERDEEIAWHYDIEGAKYMYHFIICPWCLEKVYV